MKADFSKRENDLLDEIVEKQETIKKLEDLVVKMGHSAQTIHMVIKDPNAFLHSMKKMAIGCENPYTLKKAQNSLYNGNVIYAKHDPPVVRDSEETIELAEESITKMKQKNPYLKPIDYNKWNKLNGITFVPKKQTPNVSQKLVVMKMFSKPQVVSKTLSNIEKMSSNNPFNTSEARDILDDVKKRIETLQHIVMSKTTISINNWHSSFHKEMKKVFETEITIPLNNISARVIHFEQAFLKETTDFFKDHKSLVKEANETHENINFLGNLNESLLEAVLSNDIMSTVLQTYLLKNMKDSSLRTPQY